MMLTDIKLKIFLYVTAASAKSVSEIFAKLAKCGIIKDNLVINLYREENYGKMEMFGMRLYL